MFWGCFGDVLAIFLQCFGIVSGVHWTRQKWVLKKNDFSETGPVARSGIGQAAPDSAFGGHSKH